MPHGNRRGVPGASEYNSIDTPTWFLDSEGRLGVNAHTGKAWFDIEPEDKNSPMPPANVSSGSKGVQSEVRDRLEALVTRVEAILKGAETIDIGGLDESQLPRNAMPTEKMAYKLLQDFERSLTDKDVTTLVSYALSEDGITKRWLVAGVLVNHGSFDSAAKVIVSYVVLNPENRRYQTWKWWAKSFEHRTDFKAMSRKFADALLSEFSAGDVNTKVAIADLFEQGPDAANLSLDEFKKAIHYEEGMKRLDGEK
jgi:hypothetical protein